MFTNKPIIKDATLVNSINYKAMNTANTGLNIDRQVIISNYTQETIDRCWKALSTNIAQNYYQGKGTYIKGFGTFTFNNYNVNLEGTTNQYIRDKKAKVPIFIVSNEFDDKLQPGEFTRQKGIICFNQKENKNVSIVKLNYAEIAYSVSLSKDEVFNLIKNLINLIGDSIRHNNFISKNLPGVGTLLTKGNIICVRFDDNIINGSKLQNEKLTLTKKNIQLKMDMDKAQNVMAKDLLNPYKNVEDLRPKDSLVTNLEKSADDYLKNYYDINARDIPQHEVKNIYNDINKNKTCTFNFLNDANQKSVKFKKNVITNPLSNLDIDVIKSIEFFKGVMISNMKNFDKNNNGNITKEECINAFMLSNINNKIDQNIAKNIIDSYNKLDNVDYMKFIAKLVKDCRIMILKSNGNITNTQMPIGNYENFRRENFFSNNNRTNKNLKRTTSSNSRLSKRSNSSNQGGNSFSNNFNNSRGFTSQNRFRKTDLNQSQNINSKRNSKSLNQLEEEKNNPMSKSANNFFSNRRKETEDNRKKLITITALLPELKRKYFTALDQNISYREFMNILNKYDISYPADKIINLLRFLDIPDIEAFTLNEFEYHLNSCKILTSHVTTDELNEIMKKLKDVCYIGGGANFFFNNEKNPKDTIDLMGFVNLFKDKTNFDTELLIGVYNYLVKTDREFNMNDYKNYFDNPKLKPKFDETYFQNVMRDFIKKVQKLHLKIDEYFSHLIQYNVNANDVVISRPNFIKYMQREKLNYSAEELDRIFDYIDTKKDNVIDREEFDAKLNYVNEPLTILQDIIRRYKLDIEDLAHRMNININKNEKYDFETFKNKLKKLDYTFSDEFMLRIFNALCNKDLNGKFVYSKRFLDEINFVKPASSYKSLSENYINTVKNKISFDDLKTQLEKFDQHSMGTLTKLEYVSAMQSLFPEFSDDDHMRFVRVTNMLDSKGNIIYPELLNLIYYFNKEKLNDPFIKLCQILSNILEHDCKNKIEKLMVFIQTNGTSTLSSNLVRPKPILIDQMKSFINNFESSIPRQVICKLDVDADGLISYDDLRSILLRFTNTSFFKYTNDSTMPKINLFSKETMNDTKFKAIVKNIKAFMKLKNITETGLFHKFDADHDGFISNIEFNTVIDEILPLSPALKDQFFNYLDFYHLGLVDLETFLFRFKDYDTTSIIVQNNNYIENVILDEIRKFIRKNKNLSDNEIFEIIDKDCDGLINMDDFKKFITHNLQISKYEYNDYKIERVMMSISLSKNKQIGLNDIREFINQANNSNNTGNENINLKDIFKVTANQNLSTLKKNKEWTNDIIERFGMFISEKFNSIKDFFNEYSEGNNKFKFSDLVKFHEKNYELFNNGFNLTKDELLSLFTSLDSHKKNYLTLMDLENKLQIFDFYKKMHIDVKNFLQENFYNGIDAFKFFCKSKNTIEKHDPNNPEGEDLTKYSITLKEFFDAFDTFFPKKYQTNTILKYLNKYFGISTTTTSNELKDKKDTISFSEFNRIYFDKFNSNDDFLNKKFGNTKLMTNRHLNIEPNPLLAKSQNNFYYSNLFKKKFDSLSTPFDNDPLNKIKRVVCSSKFNLNKFFESAALHCDNKDFIVNKYQFRNIIKDLDIGVTNLEIDQIMLKCGKVTYNGNLNLREFIRFLYNTNPYLTEGTNNTSAIIGEIKALIYKYYSSPIICFQNNDIKHEGKLDFEKYKNLVYDMYKRDEKQVPNFTLIKNSYDIIDLRKDGIIDMNEWMRSFGAFNGKLDITPEKVSNGFEFYDKKFKQKQNFKNTDVVDHSRKQLREWESSNDICDFYKFVNRNRKMIREQIKKCNYALNSNGGTLIQGDNLVNILKEMLPKLKLTHTQWKMVVNVAKCDFSEGLIDIDLFFKMCDVTARNLKSHPRVVKSKKIESWEFNPITTNPNGVAYKTTTNGFYYNRRSNSINRELHNLNFNYSSGNLNESFGKFEGKSTKNVTRNLASFA